jgi:hypothetical protein
MTTDIIQVAWKMREKQRKHRLYPPYLYLFGSLVFFAITCVNALLLVFIDIPDFSFTKMWYTYVFAIVFFFIGMYLLFIFIFTISLFIVVYPEGIAIKNILTKDEFIFEKGNIINIVTSESSELTEKRYRMGRKYFPYGYWHKNQIYIHYNTPESYRTGRREHDQEFDTFLFKLKDHGSFIEDCKRKHYHMIVFSID